MTSRRRPKGRYTPITAAWQDRVRTELQRRGWEQKELAARLNCSDGAVSGILQIGARTSRLVEPISSILDIAMPGYVDDIDQEMHEAMNIIREGDRDAFDRYYQEFRRKVREIKTRDRTKDEG